MTSKRKKDKLFAVTAPGLEPFTALELRQSSLLPPSPDLVQPPGLSDDDKHIEAGGVAFRGRLKVVYKANLSLRTANRVLLRLGEFYAAAFSELRKKAGRLEWERFLRPGQPVAIRVTCRKSRLYHSDAVAERVACGIDLTVFGKSTHGAMPWAGDNAILKTARVLAWMQERFGSLLLW